MHRIPRLAAVLALALGLDAHGVAQAPRPGPVQSAEWPGWGGPARNFTSTSTGLAESWPATGPRRIWSRPLGEGHSSIVVDQGRLYTMYRPPSGVRNSWKAEEVIVALDASSGKTLWEHRYPSSLETMNFSRGAGPHATPLIAGDRLFAASTDKQFFAIEKLSGKVLWSHNFVKEYGAPPNQMRWAVKPGYATSPITYRDLVIAMSGGPGHAVVAFRQADGRLAWHSGDFADDIAPASPLLITLEGEEQLVVTSGDGIHGLDPATGRIIWSHRFPTRSGVNISSPVWHPADRTLFISAAYDGGARLLRLTRQGGKTDANEVWFNTRMRVHFGNIVRTDSLIVGSSGDFGPAFLTALDPKSGEVLWQDRAFLKAHFIQADGKVIVFDEDGTLALATIASSGMKVLARASVASATSWTVPTLVGTRLYVRDRINIQALDLGIGVERQNQAGN